MMKRKALFCFLLVWVLIGQAFASVGYAAESTVTRMATEDTCYDGSWYPGGQSGGASDNEDFVGAYDSIGYPAASCLLKFDVSSIVGTVTSANLTFYVSPYGFAGTPNTFVDVYGSDDDTWDTSTFNLSGNTEIETNRTITQPASNQAYTFDVTSFIQSQVGDGTATIVLKGATSGDSTFGIYSLNNPDDTYKPKLSITYATNSPPTITSGGGGATANVNVDENTTTVTTVVGHDDDGDTLTYSINGGADAAKFTIDSSTGAVAFSSAPDYENPTDNDANNSYVVEVKVSDGTDNATQTITVNVQDANDAPTAVADAYTTDEDTPLTKDAASGVLANDTDADGDSLSAVKVTDPAHGSVTLNANGSFTYTPEANYSGTDSFTYEADDGTTVSAAATVTITVNAANDAPTVGTNAGLTVDEGASGTIGTSALESTDIDNAANELTYTVTDVPTHGTLKLNGTALSVNDTFTQADVYGDKLSYEHDGSETTSDSFTFDVKDSEGLGPTGETFAITVTPTNDAPTAVADAFETDEDTPLTKDAASGVLANDTDADGDSPSAVKVTDPAHGSVTLDADGSFTYTPDADYNGSDSFTYKAKDTGLAESSETTVTITVNASNDAPTVGTNAGLTVDEGASGTIGTSALESTDIDNAANELTYTVTDVPTHGTLKLNGTALSVNGTFTQADVDGDKLSYEHDGSETTSDSFTFDVKDSEGLGPTGETFSITVTPTNDAPTAVADAFETDEDTPLTKDAASGVLANDTDVEHNALSAVKVTDPAHGSVALNGDGSFTYTPDADYNGSDSFTYKANDGTSDSAEVTVTITVNAANDAPTVGTNAGLTVDEGASGTIGTSALESTDIDNAANELTYTVTDVPTHGTLKLNGTALSVNDTFTQADVDGDKLSYEHDGSETTSDSFTFDVKDSEGLGPTGETFAITVTPTNDAPTAVADAFETDEDTPLTKDAASGVLANDTDVEHNALSAVKVTDPAHGTVTMNADGSFTYTPEANYNGSDSFTYKVNDGDADSAAATVTITVNAANDAPSVSTNAGLMVDEGASGTIGTSALESTDIDNAANELTYTVTDVPTHGTLKLNGTAMSVNDTFMQSDVDGDKLSYEHDGSETTSDSFKFDVKDSEGLGPTGETFAITVTPTNDAPTAVADAFETDEDTPLTKDAASGVLANDTDAEGDPLSASKVTDPSHGTVTMNADGSFTYTPEANYNGSDSFTYKVNDGDADSAAATVTITVNAANDAPVAVDDSYSVNEDETLNASTSVVANDTDVDGDTLTATLVTDVAHGTLTLNADGIFTYTPDENYNGSDSFTYKANDGTSDSAEATVTITVDAVNDAPIATDDTYNVNEDGTLSASSSVLANDTDTESDTLTAALVTDAAHGTLNLLADGTFTYTPDADYNGSDSFTYKANDGTTDSAAATVTITVNAVNDAPVAVDDTYVVNEDETLNASTSVVANDTDVDGDTLTAFVVTDVAHGTLTLDPDGTFEYTPDENYNGSDSFTYKANDGTTDSAEATVTITVDAVNDAPEALDDTYSVNEDETLNASTSVLANDTDTESDTLTAALVTDAAHGTLNLLADGTFTYTPDADYNGSDSFTYKANDGMSDSAAATVTITVNAENDAPVAVDDTYVVNEDETLNASTSVVANDTDVDGDTLTAFVVTDVAHGTLTLDPDGTFEYTPDENYNGSDSFTYKANDGTTDSAEATVTITVDAVNDAPIATDDTYNVNEDGTLSASTSVLANDTDTEGDTLTATLVTDVAHGTLTLNTDGTFEYTPEADYNGSDSFTYKANDGTTDSAAATVTITVNAENDAPVAVDDTYSVNEDETLNANTSVVANDTDIDGDTLTATLVTDVAHGTLLLNADGTFTYTPDENYNGSDSFTYKANDGTTDSAAATVTITVDAVNDAPAAVDDTYNVNEDGTLSASTSVLANDTDTEGDTLTAALVTDVAHGTLTLNTDGTFEYTPEANYNGSDSFTYKANDGTTDSAAATVTITVNAVNDAPVAVDDTYSANEDETLNASTSVLANDTDIDGDTLTATLVTDVAHGTLTLNANGTFSYTPTANYHGSDSFTYKANDGVADSNTVEVTLQINDTAAPNPPTIDLSAADWTNTTVTATLTGEAGSTIEYRIGDSGSWITYSDPVELDAEGEYPLQARQTDTADNVSELAQATVRIDKTPPILTLNGDEEMSIFLNEAFTDPGATVTDNLSADLQATVTGSVDASAIGTYTLHYQAVDPAGNAATEKTRTVHVVALSADATLSGITLSSGSLSPAFSAGQTSYSVSVANSVSEETVTATAASGQASVSIDGAAATKGAQSAAITLHTGRNKVDIVVTAEDGSENAYHLDIWRDNPAGNSPGGPNNPGHSFRVLVNGVPQEEIGTGVEDKASNGQSRITVTLDTDKLTAKLDREGPHTVVTIPVSEQYGQIVASINGAIVNKMHLADAVLNIQTDSVAYRLPVEQLNLDTVMQQLGVDDLSQMNLEVNLSNLTDEQANEQSEHAKQAHLTTLVPPVTFTITATNGQQTTELTHFSAYLQRTFAIPDGTDPSRITTGVVWEPDGSFRHVPTKVTQQDGKYYADIHSLTNSTYTVVYHDASFADVAGHWSQSVVDEMASRLIVSGKDETHFDPNGQVTRAEFTAMLDRALGLGESIQKPSFTDVASSSWYYDAVSLGTEYGLISGYGNGTFDPEGRMTREQAMVLMARGMKLAGLSTSLAGDQIGQALNAFEDGADVSEWAREAAAACIQEKVVTGSNQHLNPQDDLTRAEAAAMIMGMLKATDLI